jgi:hypothetical protein
MNRSVVLYVPPSLSLAHDLRAMVCNVLNSYPDELREAASMVASELVDNAMKYGESLPHMAVPVFYLSCEEDNICIEVVSGAKSKNTLTQLKERIEAISNTQNMEELYVSRLYEIMDNRPQIGQLGLYRIGYEGRFKLSYQYSNEILSVKATRGIP